MIRAKRSLTTLVCCCVLCVAMSAHAQTKPSDAETRAASAKLKAVLRKDPGALVEEVIALRRAQPRVAAAALLSIKPDELTTKASLRSMQLSLELMESPEAQQVLLDAFEASLKDKADGWEQRVVLVRGAARLEGELAGKLLMAAAGDPHPKVRLALAQQLLEMKRPDRDAIAAAIEVLEATEKAKDLGTPHRLARQALTKRVGFDHPDAAAWRKYWADAGAAFDPAKRGPLAELKLEHDTDPRYYDEAVISRRVLFIVDQSKSMDGVILESWPGAPEGKSPRRGGGGADGFSWFLTPQQVEWLKTNPEAQLIVRAKAELNWILQGLPADAKFNIVAFETGLTPWKKSLMPATPNNVKDAKKFVDGLVPKGHTRADLALAEIFTGNIEADTVYFLSDGRPSADGRKDMPTQPILDFVWRANRFTGTTIHTYGIEVDDEAEKFLKNLATGRYRKIVGPPQRRGK